MEAASDTWSGGQLLFAGGTDWLLLGKSVGKTKKTPKEIQLEEQRASKYQNLLEPHKISSLAGVKIAWIAGGSAAVHCIAGDVDGAVYTWGRNDKGQLGHGDTNNRNTPTKVEALKDKFVVGACGGRHHSVFVTRDGEAYACGLNQQGQLGLGGAKAKPKGAPQEEVVLSPSKCVVEGCTAVSCGIDFSVFLCNGKVYAAGNPQYGQLGDGSDHVYNAKDTSIKLCYEPQHTPRLAKALEGKTITRITCGQQHSLAIDDAGAAYTWGNGGYGRLGHKVQQDEFSPRLIETLRGRQTALPNSVVAAGGTSTFCQATGGQLMGWGKMKTSGDNTMYPQPVMDLQGWNIHSMACGPGTFAVAADKSVITWGAASNGELGYGALGKKSSANPGKCNALENAHTHQVACGVGFTMFLVDADSEAAKQAPVYEPPEDDPESSDAGKGKGAAAAKGTAGGKRKAGGEDGAKPAGRGKKAK